MFRGRLTLIAILGAICLIGCGGGDDVKPLPNLVPVSGTVTFEGKPVPQGTLQLAPADPAAKLQSASGEIKNGSFTLNTTVSAPGVMAGKYKVRIASFEGGNPAPSMPVPGQPAPAKPKSLIPEKYGDINKSGLEAEVKKGMAPLKFDLKQ
ncbi:MAG: hypothetical protein JWN70_2540 [Planctomycetaceae bacterium]|nr:hypothetical protein [Planctomycetaceae bacterium]